MRVFIALLPALGCAGNTSRSELNRSSDNECKDRNRHATVGTDGRALILQGHPVSVQDCDRRRFPFVELPFADIAYAAERVKETTCTAIAIVRKLRGGWLRGPFALMGNREVF